MKWNERFGLNWIDEGFTQADQLRVVKAFRDGDYNTLVATCVAEEGLDIGEVDMIICYDAHKSPIRLIQRVCTYLTVNIILLWVVFVITE